ncbi:type II secretion system F family protein [Vibrio agarivorans]|uniref:Type II secretion system F family protein n=1 Tax=Vibrio agarivorans TaxID=153622 RepID=A0ABT7XX90_9VIBR|nr:type II secretion system F family protein [Vibrio agarivorans]MDN2480404.1 type II secretion system F family protein [Vibrio agarivorans]
MNILVSMALLMLAGVILIFDVMRRQRRDKRMTRLFSQGKAPDKPSRFGSFIVKFGKQYRGELEQKLRDAGIHSPGLAKYYFPFKFLLVFILIALVMLLDRSLLTKLMFGVSGAVAIIIIPDIILDMRKRWIVRKVSRNLPYLLDMMAVCIQTGMTIEASFAYLAKELQGFDKDLCYQIKKTSDAGKLYGIEKALTDLAERLPSAEMSSFVLTIIQNIQYGSSVSNILSSLAEDMRKIQILNIEEKMGKLSAKMSIPLILLIMFPIVILILAPGFMQFDFQMGGRL